MPELDENFLPNADSCTCVSVARGVAGREGGSVHYIQKLKASGTTAIKFHTSLTSLDLHSGSIFSETWRSFLQNAQKAPALVQLVYPNLKASIQSMICFAQAVPRVLGVCLSLAFYRQTAFKLRIGDQQRIASS